VWKGGAVGERGVHAVRVTKRYFSGFIFKGNAIASSGYYVARSLEEVLSLGKTR